VDWVLLYLSFQSGKLFTYGMEFGMKLFYWMICLAFMRVSSSGNLYGAASTVWPL